MQILFIRGNTAQNDAYTGSLGSISIDTQTRRLRIHDGVTVGGYAAATLAEVNAITSRIDGLATADIAGLDAALATIGAKADKTLSLTAGNGLTGGGDLSANRTFTLGTPGTVTGSSTNSVSSTSHTHAITVTKADVNLANVDNTSDANKPVSTAQQTALNTKVNNSSVGVADGVASLDANAKIPLSQLSDALVGQVVYKGTYNASTGSPALAAAATANKGSYYVVSVAGTQFSKTFAVGDWIISDGVIWDKVDNTDAVVSVAGRIGAVTLTKTDVGLSNVDNTSDAAKPVSTAQQTALNLKANLASPTLTGNPTAPTQATSDESTKIATTAYVAAKMTSSVSGVASVTSTAPLTISGTASEPVVGISPATTSTAGSMSSADKTKLDSVDSGAQVNAVTTVAGRTGAVVLTKNDVGLSSLQNYSVASDAQMVAATPVDTAYTTPAKVKKMIEEGVYSIDLGTFV